jgi:hypothetical protein
VHPIEIFRIGHAIYLGAANIFSAATIGHKTEIAVIAAKVVASRNAGGASAAGDAGGEDNFLADVDVVNFGTDLSNFTGDVTARDMWKRDGHTRQAAPDPKVEMVECAGMNTDQDFIRVKMRLIDIGIVKNAWITMLVENDGFHERPPKTGTRKPDNRPIYRFTILWRRPAGPSSEETLRPCASHVQIERIDRGEGGP